MKKLLFIILLFVGFTASAQYIPVQGHWEYKFLKVDSAFAPPHYTTANRPAPGGKYQIIINDDSSKIQYTVGSSWVTINGTAGSGTLTPGYGIKIVSTTISWDSANVRKQDSSWIAGDTLEFRINGGTTYKYLVAVSKVKYTDTAAMLAPYLRANLGVKYSDTASMLSPYLRKFDTTAMLAPYLRSNVAAATYYLQSNPSSYIARTGLSNVAYATYNSGTGQIGTDTTAGKLATQTMLNAYLPPLTTNYIPVGVANQYAYAGELEYFHSGTNGRVLYIAGQYNFFDATANSSYVTNNIGSSFTGLHNAGFGPQVFQALQDGNFNAAFGYSSQGNNQHSSGNTSIGVNSLASLQAAVSRNNIGVGQSAGSPLNDTLINSIFIGNFTHKVTAFGGLTNTYIFGDSIFTDTSNLAIFGRNDQRIILGNGGGNTAAMNALHNGIIGAIFFNTDSTSTGSGYCVWTGSKWINIGSSTGGGSCGSCLLSSNNLSDVASVATARANLALGTAALQNNSFFLQSANNLSDVASAATARTNLGLGTAATQANSFFLQSANNFSDVANAATARTNLGLGVIAQRSTLTNADLSGSAGITNANLANSSITIDGTVVSLGGSINNLVRFSDTVASNGIATQTMLNANVAYIVSGLHIGAVNPDSIYLGTTPAHPLLVDTRFSGSNLFNIYFDSTKIKLSGPNYNNPFPLDTSNFKIVVRKPGDSALYEMSWQIAGGTPGDYTIAFAPNSANYTVTSANYIDLADLTGQDNRTITMPAAASGKRYIIKNNNTVTSTFNWSFAGRTIHDYLNNSVTTIPIQKVVEMVDDGTNLNIIN